MEYVCSLRKRQEQEVKKEEEEQGEEEEEHVAKPLDTFAHLLYIIFIIWCRDLLSHRAWRGKRSPCRGAEGAH